MKVIPAILPKGYPEMREKLSRIEGLTKLVQIDLCDGVFGLEKTWLPHGEEILPPGFEYEFDLMIEDWKTYIPRCISLGAKRVVVHVDHMHDDDVRTIAEMLKKENIIMGVAVSNDIPVATHTHMLRIAKEVDHRAYIQVMGIERIGVQGQEFYALAADRIVELKLTASDTYVQVDGSMNPTNAPVVIQAGADGLVVGSYMFGSIDASVAYNIMTALPSVHTLIED